MSHHSDAVPEIAFEEPAMQPVFERFIALFGPEAEGSDIACDVRHVVWMRMIHAFHPAVTPREIRMHFLKTFHPDAGTEVLSFAEKNSVAAMDGPLFNPREECP